MDFQKESDVTSPYYTMPKDLELTEKEYMIDILETERRFEQISKSFERSVNKYIKDAYERHTKNYYSSVGDEIYAVITDKSIIQMLWQESLHYSQQLKDQSKLFCMHDPETDKVKQLELDIEL